MDGLKLDAIGLNLTWFQLVANLDKDGRDHGAWDRCITRVEPTIKVWSDVNGGLWLNQVQLRWCKKITRSRSNLNLVQGWSMLVKHALSGYASSAEVVMDRFWTGHAVTSPYDRRS